MRKLLALVLSSLLVATPAFADRTVYAPVRLAPVATAGTILFADGTEAAPSMSFSADTDTGIYRRSTNQVSFVTGGLARFTVAGYTAFIGNGATSATPAAGTLSGTSGVGTNIAGASLTFDAGASTGTGAGGSLIFRTSPPGSTGSAANTLTERMRITSRGDILAWTSTAQTGSRFVFDGGTENFRLQGDSIANLHLEDKGASDSSRPFQYIQSDDGNLIFGNANRNGTGTTSSVERMRVDSAGNVGINANAITSTVSVGNKRLQIQDGTNAGPELVLYNESANDSALSHITFGGIRTNIGASARISANRLGVITFGNNDAANGVNTVTERMRITSGGEVFLGNGQTSATPASPKLRATGGTGTNIAGGNLDLFGGNCTGNAAGGAVSVWTSAAGPSGTATNAAFERMRVKANGQVRYIPLAADPAGAEAGDVYYNSGTNKLKVYDGTAWVDLH